MEPKWIRHGRDRRQTFEKQLEPEELRYDLAKYQNILGKEFTIDHLLKLHEIRAKAFIAESICDFPELLMDLIGVSRKYPQFRSILGELSDLNESIKEYLESID